MSETNSEQNNEVIKDEENEGQQEPQNISPTQQNDDKKEIKEDNNRQKKNNIQSLKDEKLKNALTTSGKIEQKKRELGENEKKIEDLKAEKHELKKEKEYISEHGDKPKYDNNTLKGKLMNAVTGIAQDIGDAFLKYKIKSQEGEVDQTTSIVKSDKKFYKDITDYLSKQAERKEEITKQAESGKASPLMDTAMQKYIQKCLQYEKEQMEKIAQEKNNINEENENIAEGTLNELIKKQHDNQTDRKKKKNEELQKRDDRLKEIKKEKAELKKNINDLKNDIKQLEAKEKYEKNPNEKQEIKQQQNTLKEDLKNKQQEDEKKTQSLNIGNLQDTGNSNIMPQNINYFNDEEEEKKRGGVGF